MSKLTTALMYHLYDEDKGELMIEFLETLINDNDIPTKLRRQVWSLITTVDDEVVIETLCRAFVDSEDEVDLCARWRETVGVWWGSMPNSSLKSEIDAIHSDEDPIAKVMSEKLNERRRLNEAKENS